jgi:hypothetical protein
MLLVLVHYRWNYFLNINYFDKKKNHINAIFGDSNFPIADLKALK